MNSYEIITVVIGVIGLVLVAFDIGSKINRKKIIALTEV